MFVGQAVPRNGCARARCSRQDRASETPRAPEERSNRSSASTMTEQHVVESCAWCAVGGRERHVTTALVHTDPQRGTCSVLNKKLSEAIVFEVCCATYPIVLPSFC